MFRAETVGVEPLGPGYADFCTPVVSVFRTHSVFALMTNISSRARVALSVEFIKIECFDMSLVFSLFPSHLHSLAHTRRCC